MNAQEKLVRLLEKEGTGISWTHLTFNPWIGCTKVSPACDHCYAEALATSRLKVEWGPGAERRRTAKSTWAKLTRWQRIAADAGVMLNVFCASLADVFDNEVDPSWRIALAAEIIASPNLRWMLLTKRIGNARKMLMEMFPEGVPDNIALGVTIANQEEADRDMPKALSTKAGLGISNLFVSAEPLLGPLDLRRWLWMIDDAGDGVVTDTQIDLLITGGESGKDARPMNPLWVQALRDQCALAGTPFHFKQWGEWFRYGEVDADGHQNSRTRGEKPGLWFEWPSGEMSVRIGVKQAGHHLDGREHREHFND